MIDFDELHSADESDSNGESRNWMLLLWPDNPDHSECLQRIRDLDLDYVGILHDKDNGKPHYHFCLCYKSPKKKHQLAEKLGLNERWIRKRDSKKKMIQYLIHQNDPDKYQYSANELFGTLVDEAIKICSKDAGECEADDIKRLLGFLDTYPAFISYSFLIRKAIELGIYASFRRMGSIAIQLVKEHNEIFRYPSTGDIVQNE